jgi:hypothetical protein
VTAAVAAARAAGTAAAAAVTAAAAAVTAAAAAVTAAAATVTAAALGRRHAGDEQQGQHPAPPHAAQTRRAPIYSR